MQDSSGEPGLSGPMRGPEIGEFRIDVQFGHDGDNRTRTLWLERADDRIFISEDVLHAIEQGLAHPDVSYGDNILTIRAQNRTVSYGLVRHDDARKGWLAVKSPELGPTDGLAADGGDNE